MMILLKSLFLSLLVFSSAYAQIDADSFHQALKLKKNLYYKDGTVSGGDRNSTDVRITAIRIAPPAPHQADGYDRLVIDLSGNESGEKSILSRPPYYQVETDSALNQINVTLYGKMKLEFSTQAISSAVKKTKNISKIDLLPVVDSDRWTFSLRTRPSAKVEVFELTDPARIILDLKRSNQ